ncbi:uncharacterized protein LOC135231772 [Loxodonta africana]|uniref:uncharacterized protein LOC135231772 n=1 Tax=Loxodonta africana TaxID=9785 RepID=UPI0030CF0C8D
MAALPVRRAEGAAPGRPAGTAPPRSRRPRPHARAPARPHALHRRPRPAGPALRASPHGLTTPTHCRRLGPARSPSTHADPAQRASPAGLAPHGPATPCTSHAHSALATPTPRQSRPPRTSHARPRSTVTPTRTSYAHPALATPIHQAVTPTRTSYAHLRSSHAHPALATSRPAGFICKARPTRSRPRPAPATHIHAAVTPTHQPRPAALATPTPQQSRPPDQPRPSPRGSFAHSAHPVHTLAGPTPHPADPRTPLVAYAQGLPQRMAMLFQLLKEGIWGRGAERACRGFEADRPP